MSYLQSMLPPIVRTEGMERLDMIDWDDLDVLIQTILVGLDSQVKNICAGARATGGRNSVRSRDLFSYRVYQLSGNAQIDPVVAGVVCAKGNNGFVVRGDIAGENGGDVLFDVPTKEVLSDLVLREAVQDAAELLAQKADIIASAIQNVRRQVDS